MAVQYSAKSAVQLPRLIGIELAIVAVAAAVSFATSGPSVAVLLPASVVLGMGLYFNGARRYDVLDDRIRIVGVLGERDISFAKIRGFDAEPAESLTARIQSLLTGGSLSSVIRVETDGGFFSSQNNLWLENCESFLAAANAAMAPPGVSVQPS